MKKSWIVILVMLMAVQLIRLSVQVGDLQFRHSMMREEIESLYAAKYRLEDAMKKGRVK